jgi:exonuclease III
MIKVLQIGTWNVLTLHKGGVMRNLDKVLQEYRMDITALQEIHWLGQGILERRDCNVYYSCQKNKHEFGCGFIVNKKGKHLVMDFTPIDHRTCILRVRGRFNNMSLICTHAPTERRM